MLLATTVAIAACTAGPKPGETAAGDSATHAARLAFAITSPKAGDTLIEGKSYVVRWMAPDTFRINIGAAMGGKDKGMILNDSPTLPDSLIWTVPVGFVTGFGPIFRVKLHSSGLTIGVGPADRTGKPFSRY